MYVCLTVCLFVRHQAISVCVYLHVSIHVQLPPKPLTLRVFAEKSERGMSKSPPTTSSARPAGPKRSAGSRVCRLPQVNILKDLRMTDDFSIHEDMLIGKGTCLASFLVFFS